MNSVLKSHFNFLSPWVCNSNCMCLLLLTESSLPLVIACKDWGKGERLVNLASVGDFIFTDASQSIYNPYC